MTLVLKDLDGAFITADLSGPHGVIVTDPTPDIYERDVTRAFPDLGPSVYADLGIRPATVGTIHAEPATRRQSLTPDITLRRSGADRVKPRGWRRRI